jgi:hypothetical protein
MTFTFYSVTPKRLELARRAVMKRLRKNVDHSIVRAAARMPMDFGDLKDGPRPAGEVFMERLVDFWNRQADAIEARRLHFSIRMERTGSETARFANWNLDTWGQAVETLLFLAVLARMKIKSLLKAPAEAHSWASKEIETSRGEAALHEWMADYLSLMSIPEKVIKRQSSGRVSRWEKSLRRTKGGIAAQREAFRREVMDIEAEEQRRELIRQFRRDIAAKHNFVERQIRANHHEYRDFNLSHWLHPEVGDNPNPPEERDEWGCLVKKDQSDDK